MPMKKRIELKKFACQPPKKSNEIVIEKKNK